MSSVQMTLAASRGARTNAILDGTIGVDGVDLDIRVFGHDRFADLFWRQLTNEEFDVSELSLSAMLIMASRGRSPYKVIPVFANRALPHTSLLVRDGSGIRQGHPEDLSGKRVGVLEYQISAAVWTRGALLHEFGVSPRDIEWFVEPITAQSSGPAAGFEQPSDVVVREIRDGDDLGELLSAGELDAVLAYRKLDVSSLRGVRYLFDDRVAEGARYIAQTGIFPINHVLVVRNSLIEEHSWLAESLYEAFVASRDLAFQQMTQELQVFSALGLVDMSRLAEAKGFFPYGVTANLPTLQAVVDYAYEQGLVKRPLAIGDIMAPSLMVS
jgi:4,5-dihydroxyphthalate decarboxylase